MARGDWEDELSRPDSFPLSAAIAGSVVLVAAVLFLPGLLRQPPFWQILAGALAAALLFWGIGWFVTIRHAATAWKVGSLVILIMAGATAALGGFVARTMAIKEDMRTVAEMRIRPDGTPEFPEGAESRGPISRLYIASAKASAEDQQQFEAETVKVGLNLLDKPYLLRRSPAILDNCGNIAGLKAKNAALFARQRQREKDFLAGIDASDMPPEAKRDFKKGFETAATQRRSNRMADVQSALLDEMQAICTVLARRHWEPQPGGFAFTSGADLADFNRHTQQRNALVLDMQRIGVAEVNRSRARQEKLRREMGYRP